MSNIKLKDHSWATEGIMDTTQNKTQKVINSEVQAALSDESDTRASADTTINNKLGSVTMGTTATTVTGAIAEHESDISGINTKIGSTTMGTTATTLTGAVSELKGSLNTKVLTPSSAFSIPSYGSPVTKTMTGMTANYILVHWGFSSSAENSPPCDLAWSTANGSYTITNNTSGTAPSETIKPVFALPNAI